MILNLFIIIAFVYILVGSYTDIKTLEVPDWWNYSLIAVGFAANIIFSLVYSDMNYIIRSGFGFLVSLLIGFSMFYTGQWGGGDSKMLFGLGALLGLKFPLQLDFYSKFLINLLFAGAFYGMLWVFFMSFKNRKKLYKQIKFYMRVKKYVNIRYYSGLFGIIGLILIYVSPFERYIKMVLSMLVLLIHFTNYLFVFVKAVEKVSMIHWIKPEKLTEGDWIVDDIVINGKTIASPKDLGISKEQIQKILKLEKKGLIEKVKVKYGIPFVPSFLISIIYTIIYDTIVLFHFL